MENKNFGNLFKPARVVYFEASASQEAAEKAIKELQELPKAEKIFTSNDVDNAYNKAMDGLESNYKEQKANLALSEQEKADLEKFFNENFNKIKAFRDKYKKVAENLEKSSYIDNKKMDSTINELKSLNVNGDLDGVINHLNANKKALESIKNVNSNEFDDYEGADSGISTFTNPTRFLWRGLQFGLQAGGASPEDMKKIYEQAKEKYENAEWHNDKLLAEKDINSLQLADNGSIDSAKLLKNFNLDNKEINGYFAGLLMIAKAKLEPAKFEDYKEYLKNTLVSDYMKNKNFYQKADTGEEKMLVHLYLTLKSPEDWKKEQAPVVERKEELKKPETEETVPSGEADLTDMLFKLEDNALDFTMLNKDDKYIYARRNNNEFYRTTPEKTTLEKAVVKDGKIEGWKKVDDEELLAAYNIKKIEEEKKPEQTATTEDKEKQIKDLEQSISEKEKEMAEEGFTPEKTPEKIDEINKLKEEANKLRKETEGAAPAEKKVEKPEPSLTLKEKEEIRKEVAKLENKDLKNNKYYEFKDGVITFKNNDAQRAIRLVDIAKLFPNAKNADYTLKVERKGKTVDAKWNGKDFVDANDKHVSILSGYKISEVKLEKKAEGEIKKEPEASKEPEKATKEEQQKTEFEINKENIDKARIAARGPVRDALKREIGEELNKIANLITGKSGTVGPEFGPALKHINKLESSSIVRALSTDSANKSDLLNGILDGLKDQPKIKEYAQVAGITEEGLMDAANDLLKQNVALNIGGIAVQWNGKLNREGTLQWLDQHFAKMSDADKEKYKRFLSEKLGK